jgi:hypothetical protein
MRLRSTAVGRMLAVGCVTVVAAFGGDCPALARTRAPTTVPTYTPVFHRLARSAAVFATGDLRLIGPVGAGDQPLTGTLVNILTGARRRIVAPPSECVIAGLSTTAVAFECGLGSDQTVVEHLPSGQITPLSVDAPAEVGTDWVRVWSRPPGGHEATTYSFVNLTTGQTVPDFEKVGSPEYANLDSPGLVAKACSPVKLRSVYDGNLQQWVPGELWFVGRLAIHTSGPAGSVDAQMCGSKNSHRYPGADWAANRRIIVWNHGRVTYGLNGRTGTLFKIAYPPRVAMRVTTVAINSRDVYVQTDVGSLKVWGARIPAALR